jgi:hypothetical protein
MAEDIVFVVVIVGGIALTAVTAIIAATWRCMRRDALQAALKGQMLERGMSAAEIEEVLKAAEPAPPVLGPGKPKEWTFTGNALADKCTLVEYLVGEGWSGEDIERLLRAVFSPDHSGAGNFSGGAAPGDVRSVEAQLHAFAARATVAKTMIKSGSEVEDIEHVLRAFTDKPTPRPDDRERVMEKP